MKGLAEALREREERHSRVPKHGISDEKKQELSETLIRVEKGSKVFVEYYANFHDREKSGIVTEINRPYQFLRLDEEKILSLTCMTSVWSAEPMRIRHNTISKGERA